MLEYKLIEANAKVVIVSKGLPDNAQHWKRL